MNTAPPIDPGIPHANSKPVNTWSRATFETSIIAAPLPAIIASSEVSI